MKQASRKRNELATRIYARGRTSSRGSRLALRGGCFLGTVVAYAHRFDAVLADRLHPQRVAVDAHHVAALRQSPELVEHEAADRVVRVGVHGQVDAVVLE